MKGFIKDILKVAVTWGVWFFVFAITMHSVGEKYDYSSILLVVGVVTLIHLLINTLIWEGEFNIFKEIYDCLFYREYQHLVSFIEYAKTHEIHRDAICTTNNKRFTEKDIMLFKERVSKQDESYIIINNISYIGRACNEQKTL